jgi:hypothetical protein
MSLLKKLPLLTFNVMPIYIRIPNVAVEWDIIYSLYSEGPGIKSNFLFVIFIEDFHGISQLVHTITGIFPQIKPRSLSSITFFVIHTSSAFHSTVHSLLIKS